ncbi:MAG TPA: FAD-dependent oxidoreductase [Methylomirabilota bacterium]|nr:FAD-dependent oxidoreductase [Methylomirabilota bacterium]
MTAPRIVVLGAGPTGLGAAYRLTRRQRGAVTVCEQARVVGGNAGSFELAGQHVDYGSHRLHPACDPAVLRDLRALLGDDLQTRPRHGRIRLRGRWIHFPLKPVDLALRLPPDFLAGVGRDVLAKLGRRGAAAPEDATFADVLEAGLGRTICRDFYFPYARKVWGCAPTELAATQARRRVGASSFAKLARKVAAAVPGLRPEGAGTFYYPRKGYGQISRALFDAAVAGGAAVHLEAAVRAVAHAGGRALAVRYERDGVLHTVEADHVWSTLPLTLLVRVLDPAPPPPVLEAASALEFRAMILVYLVLEQERFSEYDAHYFPESGLRISRLSEPKNYSTLGPAGRTVLCAELPCGRTDGEWGLGDAQLGQLVVDDLERTGLPVRAPIKEIVIRRLPHAYPIYRRGFESHFAVLDGYIDGFDNVLTLGRQGLFVHDNTHHALAMAYAAVECLAADGAFDRARWHGYRRVFDSHVVED